MAFWRKGPEGLSGEPLDLAVAEECEAFLAGRYPAFARSRGWPVPVWARLNELAHGDEPSVDDMAATSSERRLHAAGMGWPGALALAAAASLALADRTPCPLAEVQRSVLIPLEGRLMDEEWFRYLTPSQLLSIVLAALEDHADSRS